MAASQDDALRKQLIQQLFQASSDGLSKIDEGDGGNEKLMFHARVFESEGRGVKDLLKAVPFQSREEDEEDDEDDKTPGKSKKSRILCLTRKLALKTRLNSHLIQ